MNINSGWEAALKFPGAVRNINRETVNSSHAIYPDVPGKEPIYADDPLTMRTHYALSLDLTEQLPATIDENGFAGENGITSDFYALNTVSGHRMNPTSVPLTDNAIIAEKLGLPTGFKTTRHRAIFDGLFDLMFRTVVPATMSIRKAASSGLPHCLSDMRLKKELFVRVAKGAPRIAHLIRENKAVELFNEFEVLNGAIMGIREQPDSCIMTEEGLKSKPREVNDALYAMTGGREGKRFDADKTVRVNGQTIEEHFAMRRRSVYAAPGWLNYFFTAIFTPLRAHYFSNYEFTWKHRSSEEIEYKAQHYKHVVGTDVKQFDQSVQRWLLEAWIDRMSDVINDDAIVLLRALLFAPFCQPDPSVHEKMGQETKPLFFGNPFDTKTWDLCPGLPSGVAPNPDLGKFICVFTYLCLLDDKYHDVLEFGVDRILRGLHPTYAILNMGDDNVFLTNDPSFASWMVTQVKDTAYYVKIGPEEGVSFLGNVFYQDIDGRIKVRPDGVTFVRNWLVPERGLPRTTALGTSKAARAFHPLGYFARKDHYQTAPSYGHIREVWEKHHRDAYNESLDARELYWSEQMKMPDFQAMTDTDKLYIIDPARIYYRLSEDEVSPGLLDKERAAISFDQYYPLVKQYFH